MSRINFLTRKYAALVLVVAAATVLILYSTDGSGLRLSTNQQIGQICSLLLAAVGLNLLVGKLGIHSFAQGAFMGIGAYAFIYAQLELELGFVLSALLATAIPALAGVAIAVATTKIRGPQLAMITLIFSVVVYKVFAESRWFGQFGGYPNVRSHGTSLLPSPTLAGWKLEPPLFGGVSATAMILVIVAAAAALLVYRHLVKTAWGLSLSAIKQSELLAQHLGVNVPLRKTAAFTFAAGMAGFGGVCFAMVFSHLQPETFGLMLGVNLIVMVILGGSGTLWGPVVGTGIVVYLQTSPIVASIVRFENTMISDRWYISAQGMIGVILLVVLFAMPAGVVGTVQSWLRRVAPSKTDASALPTGREVAEEDVPPFVGASLAVDQASLHFGGVKAVKDASFKVEPGTIVSLIGPNGAGKSSIINVITGVYRATAGQVIFNGNSLANTTAHQRARAGIARSFQTPMLAHDLTVQENILVGAATASKQPWLVAMIPGKWGKNLDDDYARAERLMKLAGVSHLRNHLAGDLSYGQQRLVELARGLMSEPSLLILDEPAAGLNPTEAGFLADILTRLRDAGLSILVVEHDMDLVRQVSERVVCLIEGEVAVVGSADHVLAHDRVIAAYLGGSESATAGQEVT